MSKLGHKKIGEYLLNQEIGSGSFSTVYKATKNVQKNNGLHYAVKCIKKDMIQKNNILK